MRLLQLINLYFRVCEVYDNRMISHCFRHTVNYAQPKFTDAEVLTCYLFATGWQKCNGPKACFEYIQNHYLDCFPDLPSYQAFNHRLNRLADVLPIFLSSCFEAWSDLESTLPTSTILTDSFPVVTASGKRHPSGCTVVSNKGRCATKALWFHGVKVHVGGWEQANTLPIPEYLIVAPASVHDKKAQQDELYEMINTNVVADKAYVDAGLKEEMALNNSELITPPRNGRGTKESDQQRFGASDRLKQKLVSNLRQPIETLFGWIDGLVTIQEASRVRSFRGLLVHIYGKFAAAICYKKLIKI